MGRARLRDLGITIGQLPPGPLQRHHRCAGRARRPRHRHPRRAARGAHRRDRRSGRGGDDIWERRRVRRLPLVQRQRRDDRHDLARGAGPARPRRSASPTPTAVGVVRDALVRLRRASTRRRMAWHLPVRPRPMTAGCSDTERFPVTQAHAFAALDAAASAAGGRGQCRRRHRHDLPRLQGRHRHRLARRDDGRRGAITVGALVQANYGDRALFRVDGVPVGREIGPDVVPHASRPRRAPAARSSSSWRPTRRCCRSSASGWRGAPPPAWPGSAASATTAAATSSSPSPPATTCRAA